MDTEHLALSYTNVQLSCGQTGEFLLRRVQAIRKIWSAKFPKGRGWGWGWQGFRLPARGLYDMVFALNV